MFSLIRLPYSYNVLEPYIDAQTMAIHHGQLHQMHVDKLNAALADYPSLSSLSILELIRSLDKTPEEVRIAVRNNAGGDACHTWFFTGIGPNEGGNPAAHWARQSTPPSAASADSRSNSFRRRWIFSRAAGSGSAGTATGKLLIESTPGNDNPWMFGRTPVLAFDAWEHAYYLKHQNRRGGGRRPGGRSSIGTGPKNGFRLS